MGFFDAMKKITKPYDDEEYYEDEEYYDEEPIVPQEEYEEDRYARAAAPAYGGSNAPETHRSGARAVSTGNGTQLQVVVAKPEGFDKVAELADQLRSKRAILLNLENTNKDTAKRLVDFLCGCSYALDGTLKKVATNTYLLTPYNVEIVGDLLDELGSSEMYL